MKQFLSRVLRGDATREQAKDTGMALVLVFVLSWLFRRVTYIGSARPTPRDDGGARCFGRAVAWLAFLM